MLGSGLATEDASSDFYTNNIVLSYDIRTILFALTNLLVPGYIVLSLLAVLSRYNSTLKDLATHGKTSMTREAIARDKPSSPSWVWVSKRCFVHFYFVGISSILITSIYHLESYNETIYHYTGSGILDEITLSRTFAIILLSVHVIRRAYECLYIQQYRDQSSKMHIAGYALGVGHYLVLPLVFWEIDATNGNRNIETRVENQSTGFGNVIRSSERRTIHIFSICILTISALNIWLQYEQHMHHVILADIRRVPSIQKKVDDEPNNSILRENQHYSRPPYNRWFRYVLSPHYLAEILLYLSFAILLEMAPATVQNNHLCGRTTRENPMKFIDLEQIISFLFVAKRYRHWILFIWVATNLTISAMNNYDWYNLSYNQIGDTREDKSTTSRRQKVTLDKRRAIFPSIL